MSIPASGSRVVVGQVKGQRFIEKKDLTVSQKSAVNDLFEHLLEKTQLDLPPGTYAMNERRIINTKTQQAYLISDQDQKQVSTTIQAVGAQDGLLQIKIKRGVKTAPVKSATPKPTLDSNDKLKLVFKEISDTETSFQKSFTTLAKAYKNDPKFRQALINGGVKPYEIDLIFEPLPEALNIVSSFSGQLLELNQNMQNATTDLARNRILNDLNTLYTRSYGHYAKAMGQLSAAYHHFATNDTHPQTKKPRISTAVFGYFKKYHPKSDIVKNSSEGAFLQTSLINFVQRPPRHIMLLQEAIKRSGHLQKTSLDTALEVVENSNNAIDALMPLSTGVGKDLRAQLSGVDLTFDKIPTKVVSNLKKIGWNKKKIDQFIKFFNAYGGQINKIEAISNLSITNPTNARFKRILRDLSDEKLDDIQSLNQRFARAGGMKIVREFTQASKQAKTPDIKNFGQYMVARVNFIDHLYLSQHFNPNEVSNTLLESAFAKAEPRAWNALKTNAGWNDKMIRSFSIIFYDYMDISAKLNAVIARGKSDFKNPTLRKEIHAYLSRLEVIEKKFQSIGGLQQTLKLDQAIEKMTMFHTGHLTDPKKAGPSSRAIKAAETANFHSPMLDAMQTVKEIRLQYKRTSRK